MKMEVAFAVAIEWSEKGDALNVVPVKMREENMRGHGVAVGLLHQRLSQIAESGAAIKHVDVAVEADLNARRVSSVT
jgi:hypothetical protein